MANSLLLRLRGQTFKPVIGCPEAVTLKTQTHANKEITQIL